MNDGAVAVPLAVWPELEAREERHEGFRSTWYRDNFKRLITIGIGRCLETNPLSPDEIAWLRRDDQTRATDYAHLVLTHDEALYLLRNDNRRIAAALMVAAPWFGDLDHVRQGVLIEMGFQLGVTGELAFKNTLAAVGRGAFDEAAGNIVDEHREFSLAAGGMLASAWAKETPARVVEMAALMAGAP
jgi:hypothetical protein